MYGYSKFEHDYTKSFYKYKVPTSEDYKVFVNGEEVPVYTCRISEYPFNRVWPGFQRPVDQTETASYVNIVSDEEIGIEVIANIEHEKILIKPYSKNVEYTVRNGRICFKLKNNGQFVLECGSYHHCLYIFNSKPVEVPEKDDVTHYFGSGVHFPGKIVLNSGDSVYVDKDALVFGCLYAENAENIHVFGNGIFDDSHEERTGNYCYENYVNGNMKFYECKNVKIEGVGMQNSAIWCLNFFACENVYVDDIKIFGQWRYNTDGIDIVNCRDVYIKNSFVHSFDDTITIKAIDRYCDRDNENIHIDGCVLWCDWGKPCEVGIETLCREYKHISFTNSDILRAGSAAFDIANGECAQISDVVFENNSVEYNVFDTQPQLQETDGAQYQKIGCPALPSLLVAHNREWRTEECRRKWGIPPVEAVIDSDGIQPRSVRDVICRNITVFYDEGLPLYNGKPIIRIYVKSFCEDAEFENIVVSNITVNGKKFTENDFDFQCDKITVE